MHRLLAPGICALIALAVAAPAAAQSAATGELIVRFRSSADAADRAETLAQRRAVVRRALGLRGLSLVRLQPGDSLRSAAAALERDPDVLYAEPNHVYRAHRTPNDPGYAALWGLPAIDAPEAWDTVTGGPVPVAVIDTGVEVVHPDLAPNLWSNPTEVGNGVDDDGNGKIDDLNGWDFVEGNMTVEDDNGHGTHVAGTIGARGNDNTGVTGVAWQVKLMALRAGDEDGAFYESDIVDAISYACAKGARVINGSFGGPANMTAISDAIAACPASLFVFSAGNDGLDNDSNPIYPCAYPHAHIVCVAATTATDELAVFSNYGLQTVDLGAPGAGILSTVPPSAYATFSGTSMAAPHVAGAAALVLAQRPALTALELRAALLNGVDPVPALAPRVGTGGRLNVNKALTAPTSPPVEPPPPSPPPPPPPAAPPPAPPPPADVTAPTDPAVASTSHVVGLRSIDSTVEVSWSGAFDFGSGIDGFSFSWDSAATSMPDTVKDAEEAVAKAVSPPLPPGIYWFHLRTRDNAGNWSAGTHVGPYVITHAAIPQPQRCTVPKVRGKTLRAAARVLRRAGCKLGPVKRVRARVRRGRIVAQRPAAGRKVGKGTPVVVTLSRGRP